MRIDEADARASPRHSFGQAGRLRVGFEHSVAYWRNGPQPGEVHGGSVGEREPERRDDGQRALALAIDERETGQTVALVRPAQCNRVVAE
jgi:hypothetical protein